MLQRDVSKIIEHPTKYLVACTTLSGAQSFFHAPSGFLLQEARRATIFDEQPSEDQLEEIRAFLLVPKIQAIPIVVSITIDNATAKLLMDARRPEVLELA